MRFWLFALIAYAYAWNTAESLEILLAQMSRRLDHFDGDVKEFPEMMIYLENRALPNLKTIVASLPLEMEDLGHQLAKDALSRAVLTLEGMCAIQGVNNLPAVWESVHDEIQTAIRQFGPTSGLSRLRVWLATIFS